MHNLEHALPTLTCVYYLRHFTGNRRHFAGNVGKQSLETVQTQRSRVSSQLDINHVLSAFMEALAEEADYDIQTAFGKGLRVEKLSVLPAFEAFEELLLEVKAKCSKNPSGMQCIDLGLRLAECIDLWATARCQLVRISRDILWHQKVCTTMLRMDLSKHDANSLRELFQTSIQRHTKHIALLQAQRRKILLDCADQILVPMHSWR